MEIIKLFEEFVDTLYEGEDVECKDTFTCEKAGILESTDGPPVEAKVGDKFTAESKNNLFYIGKLGGKSCVLRKDNSGEGEPFKNVFAQFTKEK